MERKDWLLQYGSLKEGLHHFDYQLDNDFFDSFEQDLVHNGHVKVLLNVHRSENYLQLDFKIEGALGKECDVCLSELDYPIKGEASLHVKISDKEIEDEPDLIQVPTAEIEIDLRQHLFDYTLLQLPMRIECKDSVNRKECDAELLSKLNPPEEDDKPANEDHPEWQKLKGIFKN